MTTKLTDLQRPFICGAIFEPDPPSAIADMKMGECDGAQAFEFNLASLEPEYRNVKALTVVFRRTTLPIFTTYRRSARMATEGVKATGIEDEERMRLQCDLIDVGSAGFDMELDTYDRVAGPPIMSAEGLRYSMDPTSPPREVIHNPGAVERQVRLIEEAHRRGGQVLASSHCLTRINVEGVVRICRLAEERGADLLKLVRFSQTYEDLVETLAETVALRRQASIPFVMMSMGEYGKLSRLLTPLLGSMLCFCKQSYGPGAFTDQPLIRQAKAVFDNIDYKITARAEEFMPEWYARAGLAE